MNPDDIRLALPWAKMTAEQQFHHVTKVHGYDADYFDQPMTPEGLRDYFLRPEVLAEYHDSDHDDYEHGGGSVPHTHDGAVSQDEVEQAINSIKQVMVRG